MKEKKQKKGIAKRFFGAFLVLAMVFAMLPVSSMTANAENAETSFECYDINVTEGGSIEKGGVRISCDNGSINGGVLNLKEGGSIIFESLDENTSMTWIYINFSKEYKLANYFKMESATGNYWSLSSHEVSCINKSSVITLTAATDVNDFQLSNSRIMLHTHTWSSDWTITDSAHYHVCTDDACPLKKDDYQNVPQSGYAAHDFGAWTSNNDATTEADGTKSRTCSVCGYVETVTDEGSKLNKPSSQDSGKVAVSEEKQSGNFSAGGLVSTADELQKAVLTDSDKAAMADGENINIWLEMKDQSTTVSDSDKAAIIATLPTNCEVGTYLDINLWKQIEGNEASKVTETNGMVKVAFTIPESLQKSDRVYQVIRLHNGEVEALDTIVDENYALTFETNGFSTYALVYRDKASATEKDTTTTDAGTTSPKTGDTSNVSLYLVILMLGAAGIVGLSARRKRQ